MSDKVSIRFFDNREVRAIWDETNSKWCFSVLDIVAVLTDQDNYTKTRNYWKYLKAKLKKEENQVVSNTTQLKMLAPDGKKRLADVLDYDGIIALGKTFPWTKMSAMIVSPTDRTQIAHLIQHALTDDIYGREMFMKWIDYSYYYEEEDIIITP